MVVATTSFPPPAESVMPTFYHYSNDVYWTGGFALTNFVVCPTAAAVPLLAALWMFDRKAY